jgi:DNA-binding IclR family transcriptional regulator
MTVPPDTDSTPVRGKRPKQGEPVIDRALSLLAVFSDRRRTLTLSELARHAGMPAPTALRLIARLVAWGALERLEDGRYVVGVRLWEVASLSPRGHGVREIALPYLEDLFEVTRHHVLLAVRDNSQAVLIERLSSKDATEVAYRVGGRVPLRTTAVGLVLLAGADQPIIDAQGAVVAALSIVVPDGSTPANVLAPAVRATARAVSRNLGHRAEVSPGVRTHSEG